MTKQHLIEAIREHNHSANPRFLKAFDEHVLTSYLRRLRSVHNQRGRQSRWVREGDTPAIVRRVAA